MGFRALRYVAILCAAAIIGGGVVGCGTLLSLDDTEPAPAKNGGDGAADANSHDETGAPNDGASSTDAGDDAAFDAGPGCPGGPACDRVVFVTSAVFTATDLQLA